jgi:hypothetical protein
VYTDPTSEVEGEIQQFRRRPLLIGLLTLGFIAFGIWYMTGGSATGSVGQAEAAIRADPFPGNPTHPAVVTVQCTQNGQPFFARLQSLFHPDNGSHTTPNGPSTTYTCDGTVTTGQTTYWCVTFTSLDSSYSGPPTVAVRLPNASCSAP